MNRNRILNNVNVNPLHLGNRGTLLKNVVLHDRLNEEKKNINEIPKTEILTESSSVINPKVEIIKNIGKISDLKAEKPKVLKTIAEPDKDIVHEDIAVIKNKLLTIEDQKKLLQEISDALKDFRPKPNNPPKKKGGSIKII